MAAGHPRRPLTPQLGSSKTARGERLSALAKGERDPCHESTGNVDSESALYPLQDVGCDATPGGVWTAGGQRRGLALVRRLQARVGWAEFRMDCTKGEPPPPPPVCVAGLLCFPHLLVCPDLLRMGV